MKNMILSDNGIEKLEKLLEVIPLQNHIKIHAIHNVEYRDTWGLTNKTINDFLFAYIREGSGYYLIDGVKCPIEKGRVVIISSGIPFSAFQDLITPSLISIRFGIYSNKTQQYIKNTNSSFYISFPTELDGTFFHSFEHINQRYTLKSTNILYERSCNTYLTYMLQEALLKILSMNNKSGSLDMRLESVKLYIEKNIHSNITIDKLSRIAGLSNPYFSKLFKKQYGITLKEYIFQNKMNRAYFLLSQRGYNVKSTAYSLGYSDPFIFSNQFKRHYGYPPSQVKKTNK